MEEKDRVKTNFESENLEQVDTIALTVERKLEILGNLLLERLMEQEKLEGRCLGQKGST